MGGIAKHLGFSSNNVAEIVALEVGLNQCVSNNQLKVVIEGDSQVIINRIANSLLQNWKLASWIPKINSHLQRLTNFKVQHIFKEGNQVANKLVNLGIGGDSFLSLDKLISIPEDLKDLICVEADRVGIQ